MRILLSSLLACVISFAAAADEIRHGVGKGWMRFAPYQDAPAELQGLVRQLLEQDNVHKDSLALGELPMGQVYVARHDLNDDGQPEIVVGISSQLYCGTAGCEAELFEKRGDRWVPIGSAEFDEQESWVSDEKSKGFRAIYSSWGMVARWTDGEYLTSCAEALPPEMNIPKIICRASADEQWSALGRYQMRRPALIDVRLLNEDLTWTGKFGVNGWRDFLSDPKAQEATMVEWADKMAEYARTEGTLRHVGRKIVASNGEITVTEGGLIAAMHNAGGTGVRRYFEWLDAHGWNSQRFAREMPARFEPIEARLRAFQDIALRK